MAVRIAPYVQAAPLVAVLAVFLVVPLAMLLVVSFFDYDSVRLIPAFIPDNYLTLFGEQLSTTVRTYVNTIRYAALTWAITFGIGFWVGVFPGVSMCAGVLWQTSLFLLCTIPFWTSNIIRMISWVPFLGRNGIANNVLLKLGFINQPLEMLLFSDFAVVLALVHLYTLFMVVPIFNTMMRIDRRLIEAANDAGAKGWQTLVHVILPLCKPGIAIGTVFVVTLVMGDFITVRLMSGGQSASVGLMIYNEISLLQYPAAAANAIVLLLVVMIMVGLILRAVDIRKEL